MWEAGVHPSVSLSLLPQPSSNKAKMTKGQETLLAGRGALAPQTNSSCSLVLLSDGLLGHHSVPRSQFITRDLVCS